MQSSQTKKFSLRENVRLRILKDMLSSVKQSFDKVPNFIMVLDPVTIRIISASVKMIELLEEGVVTTERLDLKRKPFPKMHAIYFITPTESSINSLMNDFNDQGIYGFAHIFFTNKLDSSLMEKLSKKKSLAEKVLTFKEINLDFLSPEANIFHFDMDDAVCKIFSKKGTDEAKALEEKIGYKLASVIPTLVDYEKFHIVYNKNSNNPVAEKVANIVKERIGKFLSLKKSDDDDDEPAPVKIIILDRTFDPLTPLLHDIYYSSMIYDLMDVKNDEVEYSASDKTSQKTKKAILNESDDLWMKYKYHRIDEAQNMVSDDISVFLKNNSKVAAMQKGQAMDAKDMAEIVKQMPMYQELLAKYAVHKTLTDKCVQIFNEKELRDLIEVEQSLATGVDNKGEVIKNQKLITLIAQRIAQGKMEGADKLRLMMVASAALDLSEKDRKTLIQSLTDSEKNTLRSLYWLGIDPNKPKNKVEKKNKSSTDPLRYTPVIETLAANAAINKIDKNEYGHIYIPSNYDGSIGQRSKISAGATTMKKAGKSANWNQNMDERNQPKFIFFVIGGLSYTEIRILQDFENSNAYLNVLAGSTSIVNPRDFIKAIGMMVPPSE